MIRLAISGAGAITERAHIPAFLGVGEIQIVAIQSRTSEKAQLIVAALPPNDEAPRTYIHYDEMLAREHPDAVGIFTPNALHCEFTSRRLPRERMCWWKSRWRRRLLRRARWWRPRMMQGGC